MRLDQFYHVVKAAASIANVEDVNVFGSNAILPWLEAFNIYDMRGFLDPQDVSRELDLSVGDGEDDDLNTLIDGTIGESTHFDTTFNTYAHPNAIQGLFHAPPSWPKRAKFIQVPGSNIKAVVPHYLDLAVSKIVAGRRKDLEFVTRVVELFEVQEMQLNRLIDEYLQQCREHGAKVQRTINILKTKLAILGLLQRFVR